VTKLDTTHPVTGGGHGVDDHRFTIGTALLLHHHGVRAGGDEAAGENPRGGRRLQRLRHGTGGDALAHAQPRAGGGHVGAAHGVAVHRRVVCRRHIDSRTHVVRQNPAQRLRGRQDLRGRQGLRRSEQTLQRHIRVDQGGGSRTHG